MRKTIRPVLLLSAALAMAQHSGASAKYFPLQVGNQWILETAGPNPQVLNIEVLRSRVYNDTTYYSVSGYSSREMWFRATTDGIFYSYDPASNRETKQAQLAHNAQPYLSALSGCNQTARPEQLQIFPGEYPNLRVPYDQNNCTAFRFRQETYRYNVGLIQRTVIEADGTTRLYRLVYARVDGRIVTGDDGTLVLLSDFRFGARGWLTGFSDYSTSSAPESRAAELKLLPQEIDDSRNGLFLKSDGAAADYFMFFKRAVTAADGLKPDQSYELTLDFIFDSNAQSGCTGDTGAPGEDVFLKAGASASEPLPVPVEEGRIAMSIDKGERQDPGADMGVIGSIENGKPCSALTTGYVRLRRSYTHGQPLRTDGRGVLWLIVGTDSGYGGPTALYYESVTARLKPLP